MLRPLVKLKIHFLNNIMMIIYAVAERISYFCLAWNLIQPLGSKHIFTQSGWLMLFIPIIFPGSTNWGKPAKHSLPQNFFVLDRRNDCPLSWIAAAAPPWEKPTNSWTPCVYSLRPRVLSWIWIRWIQYATHRNNLKSPPALAMSTAMKIPLQQPATSSLATFSGCIHVSPVQLEPQTHGWLHHFCS